MYPSVMMTLAREAPCMDQNKGFFNDIIGIFVVVSPYMYIFNSYLNIIDEVYRDS